MKKIKLLIIISTFFATACSNNISAPLVQDQKKQTPISVKGDILNAIETPKAEIVFVIDNSKSMEKHINNVSKNIDKFVDAFIGKTALDFHIAVTSVYDSRRFSKKIFQEKYSDQKELLRDNGEFYPSEEQFFLNSNDPELKPKLKNLLKIGVQGLDEAGPEVEEILSPLLSIYGKSAKKHNSHKGFFISPKSYKIFFLVTDASDNSIFDTTKAYFELVESAAEGNRDKIMAFGAIVPKIKITAKQILEEKITD